MVTPWNSIADVMVIAEGTVYRLITDHVGSVRLVVNVETGEVVQRMDYDAFGRVLNAENADFQPFGFAGGLYDDDTKLVRFGARDYDEQAGRWTATDPMLLDGSVNLYEYAYADPINLVDVTGNIPIKNETDEEVVATGNPGTGRGKEKQEKVTLQPGQRIDSDNPVSTERGPVTDVDYVDLDGDGVAETKVRGTDRGYLPPFDVPGGLGRFPGGELLECVIVPHPLLNSNRHRALGGKPQAVRHRFRE